MQELPLNLEVLIFWLNKNPCRLFADYIQSTKFEFASMKTRQ